MAEHTNPPWKWHPKSTDHDHNGSVYSEHRTGHAYAIAMQPRYVTDEEWAITAPMIVRAVNSQEALVKALEPFAELHNEGSEDFSDDEPVTIRFGRTTNFSIKLGDIRRANVAYAAATAELPEPVSGADRGGVS